MYTACSPNWTTTGGGGMSRKLTILACAAIAAASLPGAVRAQQRPTEPDWPLPMNTNPLLGYVILNQNEIRTGNGMTIYRVDGEGWYDGNLKRLTVSSETNKRASDCTRAHPLGKRRADILQAIFKVRSTKAAICPPPNKLFRRCLIAPAKPVRAVALPSSSSHPGSPEHLQ